MNESVVDALDIGQGYRSIIEQIQGALQDAIAHALNRAMLARRIGRVALGIAPVDHGEVHDVTNGFVRTPHAFLFVETKYII